MYLPIMKVKAIAELLAPIPQIFLIAQFKVTQAHHIGTAKLEITPDLFSSQLRWGGSHSVGTLVFSSLPHKCLSHL